MAQKTTTDDESATKDDLQNVVPSAGFRETSNNEEIKIYPDPTETARGVIQHTYDGLPARGVVLYDIVDYEIVDSDFEPVEETMADDMELYGDEIREYIDGVLFDSSMSSPEGNCGYVDHHTVTVENPWDGDSYTVELETDNKRRVA